MKARCVRRGQATEGASSPRRCGGQPRQGLVGRSGWWVGGVVCPLDKQIVNYYNLRSACLGLEWLFFWSVGLLELRRGLKNQILKKKWPKKVKNEKK